MKEYRFSAIPATASSKAKLLKPTKRTLQLIFNIQVC